MCQFSRREHSSPVLDVPGEGHLIPLLVALLTVLDEVDRRQLSRMIVVSRCSLLSLLAASAERQSSERGALLIDACRPWFQRQSSLTHLRGSLEPFPTVSVLVDERRRPEGAEMLPSEAQVLLCIVGKGHLQEEV